MDYEIQKNDGKNEKVAKIKKVCENIENEILPDLNSNLQNQIFGENEILQKGVFIGDAKSKDL